MPGILRKFLTLLFVPVILLAVTACPGVIIDHIQITLGPNGAIVAASITFSCISPVTGDVVQYNWVFGDGATATGQTVSHAYSSEGTFVIECHVVTSGSVLIFKDIITIGPRFTNLYWTHYGLDEIQTCPIATCSNSTLNTLVDTGLDFPFGMAATSTDLYWSDWGNRTIETCPITNCSNATTTTLLTSAVIIGIRGIAATETDLYWTDITTDEILTCAIGNCSDSTVVTLIDSGLNNVFGMTATETDLYWTDIGSDRIQTCPIVNCSNGTVKTLVDSGLDTPMGIVARGDTLYWADLSNNRILSCPIASCSNASVNVLNDSVPSLPFGVAASDTDLYWTEEDPGRIYTCPISNCTSPTLLISHSLGIQMIVVGRVDPSLKLTLSVDGTGSGDVTSTRSINCSIVSGVASGTCDETYGFGTAATLTATPATDFTFDSWTNCSNPSGDTCNHIVLSDVTITANFVRLYTLTVEGPGVRITSDVGGIDCNNNSGTCEAIFPAGTVVELTAMDGSATFQEWSIIVTGSTCVGTNNPSNPVNVTMNGDRDCLALSTF